MSFRAHFAANSRARILISLLTDESIARQQTWNQLAEAGRIGGLVVPGTADSSALLAPLEQTIMFWEAPLNEGEASQIAAAARPGLILGVRLSTEPEPAMRTLAQVMRAAHQQRAEVLVCCASLAEAEQAVAAGADLLWAEAPISSETAALTYQLRQAFAQVGLIATVDLAAAAPEVESRRLLAAGADAVVLPATGLEAPAVLERLCNKIDESLPPVVAGYLRPELLKLLPGIPEQTTWDLPTMRARGDELFGAEAQDSTVRLTLCETPSVQLRVIEPNREKSAETLEGQPVLVAIHGGGLVAGRAAFDDARNAELARELNATVISPEYRLAPEHPHPAGLRDCLEAVTWAQQHYAGRPLFLFGDSAGGALAYATTVYTLRDGTLKPSDLQGLILFEPCLDPETSSASFRTHRTGPVWTAAAAKAAWRHYANPYTESIPRLDSLQKLPGFPPTQITVNPCDPLRDEGISLALALIDQGIETEMHLWPGTFHGSLSAPGTETWAQVRASLIHFINTHK